MDCLHFVTKNKVITIKYTTPCNLTMHGRKGFKIVLVKSKWCMDYQQNNQQTFHIWEDSSVRYAVIGYSNIY
jgi:hypothetical protein